MWAIFEPNIAYRFYITNHNFWQHCVEIYQYIFTGISYTFDHTPPLPPPLLMKPIKQPFIAETHAAKVIGLYTIYNFKPFCMLYYINALWPV